MTDHAKPVSDTTDDVRPSPGVRERPERRTLPRAAAFWILAANSWMHTPAGYQLVDGKFQPTSWLADRSALSRP